MNGTLQGMVRRLPSSFDKLRMRMAIASSGLTPNPHPEPVEGSKGEAVSGRDAR